MTRAICKVEDCDTHVFGHGYCNMHYKRWRKTGDPGPAETVLRKHCSVEGCPEPHAASGYCGTHFKRFKVTGQHPTTPIRRLGLPRPQCPRPHCENVVESRGLCSKHVTRLRHMLQYDPEFSWDKYDALYAEQEGLCAICKEPIAYEGRGTHLDHCHAGGGIRGILCRHCNSGLGYFRDNPSHLTAAVAYLAGS